MWPTPELAEAIAGTLRQIFRRFTAEILFAIEVGEETDATAPTYNERKSEERRLKAEQEA